jgi:hypothetical protein
LRRGIVQNVKEQKGEAVSQSNNRRLAPSKERFLYVFICIIPGSAGQSRFLAMGGLSEVVGR